MTFSEKLKTELRKQADFRCCICHNIGVEIHHIIPLKENGSDDVENAAPLCPSCHDLYGSNPDKRRFIRETRDSWFEILEKRKEDMVAFWGGFSNLAERLPTKEELLEVKADIISAISLARDSSGVSEKQSASIGDLLQFIYNIEDPSIRDFDKEFLFEFAFGGEIDHEEFELAKNAFVEEFGIVSAKHLCGWVLCDHQFRPSSPFTAHHLHQFINDLFNGITLFLNHEDVSPIKSAFGAFVANDNSDIFWYIAEDVSEISTSRDAS